MNKLPLDAYVIEVLMRDLVGHDRAPSAFLVYLYLWSRTMGAQTKSVRISHQRLAEATGLSKSAVQGAARLLTRRKLVRVHLEHRTAAPEYTVLRPWIRSKQ